MAEKDRKTLSERLRGKLDQNVSTHIEVSLMRDTTRSWRTRLRFLFSLSGFCLVAIAMVLVPVSMGLAAQLFGDAGDASASHGFINAALGLSIILMELAVIFKLYAHAIDLELWFTGLTGSSAADKPTRRAIFLKVCAMGFIAISMTLTLWGMLGPISESVPRSGILLTPREQHEMHAARQGRTEKAHKLACLSLLMAILSLLYFNEVRREELAALAEPN